MESLSIDDLGYVEEMRKRLGYSRGDEHFSTTETVDEHILKMSPMDRARLIFGWELGDPEWVDTVKDYFESQGLYLTTNPDADGVIHDNELE